MPRFLLTICLSCFAIISSSAESDSVPLQLSNGENRLDFTGDGKPDLVMIAHRANFNAHGFDVVTFYTQDADPVEGGSWTIVPLFVGTDESQHVTVGGGADCLLHDFRLFQGMLIVADREVGDSFADPAKVTFTYYELRRNSGGEIGWPLYRFEKVRSQPAAKPYCDVEDAFKNELNIPRYRSDGE